jgi:hypothetical protein
MLQDLTMDIELLKEIKSLASEALQGRTKLEKLSSDYIKAQHEKRTTRARTTTYNARAADIMENTVTPCEKKLREILRDGAT